MLLSVIVWVILRKDWTYVLIVFIMFNDRGGRIHVFSWIKGRKLISQRMNNPVPLAAGDWAGQGSHSCPARVWL